MKITTKNNSANGIPWEGTTPGAVYLMDGAKYVLVVRTRLDDDAVIDIGTGFEVRPGSVFIPVDAEVVIRDA